MNSEELEKSLRTEFESYLKKTLGEVRQDVTRFQEKIEAELQNHKSHLDDVFKDFSGRVQMDKELDEGFTESVIEHLRLSRDEGARITATAIAEGEEMAKAENKKKQATAVPSVDFSVIRDAVNDISSKNSQSAILKALIEHAAKFTPRGAFFVVKNQHFVGWRVFGSQEGLEENAITEIVFPVSDSTVLGESVEALSVVESAAGIYSDDAQYLDKLEFGQPGRIFAIPLIARGRGVAAIYADEGENGGTVNTDVLETLVNVAGLTVELLAAGQGTPRSTRTAKRISNLPETAPADEESYAETATESVQSPVPEETYAETAKASEYHFESEPAEAEFDETEEIEEVYAEPVTPPSSVAVSTEEEEASVYDVAEDVDEEELPAEPAAEEAEEEVVYDVSSESEADQSKPTDYQAFDDDLIEEVQTREDEAEVAFTEEADDEQSSPGYAEVASEDSAEPAEEFDAVAETDEAIPVSTPSEHFETNQDFNSSPVQFEESSVIDSDDVQVAEPETAGEPVTMQAEPEVATFDISDIQDEVAEEDSASVDEPAPAAPVKTRFSDRNVDLPIDVSEEERRLHNDARRFARLLISEIKLYNEQKVKEGRDSADIYERLRDAIDRSREMYDKRVQPAVVERFDYFHFEVVNTLAEGEESKLGTNYPGAVA